MAELVNGKHVRLVCAVGTVIGVLLVMLAASGAASADGSHEFTGTYGAETSVPKDPYPLSGPTDVEVNQKTHDLYVTDPGNHRVEVFGNKGEFLFMIGKDVDQNTAGYLCPEHQSDVCQAGVSSSSPGGLETPTYLAIDNSNGPYAGDIYVVDEGDDRVSKFTAAGELVNSFANNGQLDLESSGELWGAGVAPNGDIYVGVPQSNEIRGYNPEGQLEVYFGFSSGAPWLKLNAAGEIYVTGTTGAPGQRVLREGSVVTSDWPTTGFALDPSDGELYQDVGVQEEEEEVIHGPQIDHYSSGCEPAHAPCEPSDSFGGGHLFGAAGVAVDGISHAVYVANSSSNDVAVFGDLRPTSTTGPAINVTASSVTLSATIDPAGHSDITKCRFEYGFYQSYGQTVPCSPDPESQPFSSKTEVTQQLPAFHRVREITTVWLLQTQRGRPATGSTKHSQRPSLRQLMAYVLGNLRQQPSNWRLR